MTRAEQRRRRRQRSRQRSADATWTATEASQDQRHQETQRDGVDLPLLMATRLVCRERLPTSSRAAFASIAHRVNAFLDSFSTAKKPQRTEGDGAFFRAVKRGDSTRALEYLAPRESRLQTLEALWAAVAAYHGHLHVLRWLHEHPELHGQWRTERYCAMDAAAHGGHLDVLRWLQENRQDGCTTDAMDDAAADGHLEVVRWLHNHRVEGCTVDAMDLAASHGHLEMLWWLDAHRDEGWSAAALSGAAARGDLTLLRWLRFREPELCTNQTTQAAARRGHAAVVRWLLDNGRQADARVAFRVAREHGQDAVQEAVTLWLQQ